VKKILYVTTLSRTINMFLLPHIEMLISEGNVVDCACSIEYGAEKDLKKKGIKVYDVPFRRNPFHFKNYIAYKKILKICKENNYDIIHVHTPVAAFVARAALRKRKKIRIIYTAHGLHFYKGAPVINWILYYPLERIAAHWTDCIVAINSEDLNRLKSFNLRNHGKTQLIHGVGIEKDVYEVCNFDSNKYKLSFGLKQNDFTVLILAEINKNKNQMQIIKAMKLLKVKYPEIKILLAGEGQLYSKLIKKTHKLQLDDNILFLGLRSDVKELLNVCDCVALFSKREGLGKCLLEGMISGKPLLATNTRGAKELIENGRNGFLVRFNDYKSTALLLEKLYLSSSLREEFGIYSQKKVSNYLIDNVLK
jgi:glycosyltransferase involved in cell wall biosynthesis